MDLYDVYSNMISKWGFNDGADIPTGINKVRELIIRLLNKEAKKRGYGIRFRAFDRVGLHNWCMIESYAVDGEIADPNWVRPVLELCDKYYLETTIRYKVRVKKYEEPETISATETV